MAETGRRTKTGSRRRRKLRQFFSRPSTGRPFYEGNTAANFLGLINVLRSGEIFERIAGTDQLGGAVLIRPNAASMRNTEGRLVLETEVRAAVFRGYFFQIQVHCAAGKRTFMPPDPLPLGRMVTLSLDAAKILRVPL